MNLKTPAQSESIPGESAINTTVSSQERPKVWQIDSELNDLSKTLDDARSVLERAKRKRYDVESAIQDETKYLEAELYKERELRCMFQSSCRNQLIKHERQVDILLTDVDNKRKELECLRKDAHDDKEKRDRESLALVIAIQGFQQKLTAEQQDKRKLEQAHSAYLKQVQGEFEKLRRELRLTVRKKDDLEDQLVSMRKDKIQLENVYETIHRNLKKAAEDERKLEEAHTAALMSARRDHDLLGLKLQQSVTAKAELEKRLISMQEEEECLRAAHGIVLKNLEEEKEKSLCQICLELPKDSICLPCLHFHYCSSCLRKHRERNRTCPSCRGVLSGVLSSDICA